MSNVQKTPLCESRIEVVEQPGKPGAYSAVAHLRPWLQLEEIDYLSSNDLLNSNYNMDLAGAVKPKIFNMKLNTEWQNKFNQLDDTDNTFMKEALSLLSELDKHSLSSKSSLISFDINTYINNRY